MAATQKNDGKTLRKRRGVLDTRTKERMMAVILRNQSVFERVRPLLKVADLRTFNDGIAVLYKQVSDFFDQFSRMPGREQMKTIVQQSIADHPGELQDPEIEYLDEYIDLIFDKSEFDNKDLARNNGYQRFAYLSFKQFKEDLVASLVTDNSLKDNKVPLNLAASLQNAVYEVEAAATLGAVISTEIFPSGWMNKEKAIPEPTLIESLDKFMGGGLRPGESLLFMGPYGSCKTVISVQGLVLAAKRARERTEEARKAARKKARAEGQDPDKAVYAHHVAVLASYEMPLEEMQERTLAVAANITRDRLRDMTSYSHLRRKGQPALPYELERYKNLTEQGIEIPSEYKRAKDATKTLNLHAIFLALDNSDPENPTRGTGGAGELSSILRALKADRPNLVFDIVYIDHLAAMASNIMAVTESKDPKDELRLTLKTLPKRLTNLIAKANKCPIVILHQLSAEANSRSVTARMHHTDGDECRAVATYVDWAIQTTSPNREKLCVFGITKQRHKPPTERRVVRIDGNYNQVRDCHDEFRVDETSKKILSAEEMKAIEGSEEQQEAKTKKVKAVTPMA